MKVPTLSAHEADVLRLLISNPKEMYGLQLVRESGGALKRGTVYVTLQRMEEKGFVVSREEREGPDGLPRRFYRYTGFGQRALAAREVMAAAMLQTREGAL